MEELKDIMIFMLHNFHVADKKDSEDKKLFYPKMASKYFDIRKMIKFGKQTHYSYDEVIELFIKQRK